MEKIQETDYISFPPNYLAWYYMPRFFENLNIQIIFIYLLLFDLYIFSNEAHGGLDLGSMI